MKLNLYTALLICSSKCIFKGGNIFIKGICQISEMLILNKFEKDELTIILLTKFALAKLHPLMASATQLNFSMVLLTHSQPLLSQYCHLVLIFKKRCKA